MFAIPAPVREGAILCAFLLCAYVAIIAPPILMAEFIGGTALRVWASVVFCDFLCGVAVIVFGATFDIRPRLGAGFGLLCLSVLNFLALPLYVLLMP